MKFIAILSIVFLLPSFAATKRAGDDLAKQRTVVLQMGARLTTLEKEINSKNDLYQSSVKQIKQFEQDIALYRVRLKELGMQVGDAQAENLKILKSYLIESDNESVEAWQKKVHLELLKQAQQKYNTKQSELESLKTKVNEFDTRLTSLRKDEEELSLVIRELESRKKVAMDNYLSHVKTKKIAEAKYQNRRLDTALNQVKKEFSQAPLVLSKPDRMFDHPVKDYISLNSSPKGVTFKYKAVQPVKAVGDGKIVFAGDLASYGQVILLDHGNDLRTVLLGRLTLKVKKNEIVSAGDILAYTANDTQESQNLYFEIRKKNTAQNTILWLDSSGVSKI